MRDFETVGPSPVNEDCADIGKEDYRSKALPECARFIALIRECCGPEPEGAELITKGSPHDYGTYYEVYVRFERENAEAVDYAYHCQGSSPVEWTSRPSHLADQSKPIDPATSLRPHRCGGTGGTTMLYGEPTCFRCAQLRAAQVRAEKKAAAQTNTEPEASHV